MNKLRIICVLLAMGTLGCMSGCNTNALKTQNISSQISSVILPASSRQSTANSIPASIAPISASSDTTFYSSNLSLSNQNKSVASKSSISSNTGSRMGVTRGMATGKRELSFTEQPDGVYISNMQQIDSATAQSIIDNDQNKAFCGSYFLLDRTIIIGNIEYNVALNFQYAFTKPANIGVKTGNYKTFEVYSVKNKPATEGIILYRSNLWITILKATPDSIKIISNESSSIASSSIASK